MDSPIVERIKEYLAFKSLSIREFERICGLGNGVLGRLSQSTKPSTFKKISSNSDLNVEWLLTGEGDMLNDTSCATEAVSDTSEDGNYRLVDLINIDSVGGMHSENAITPSEQYIIGRIPFTEAREGDVAILQSGKSMYPTIPSGSALLIREVVDWQEYFGYGGIFVLWLKDGRRITKEVRRYDPDPKNYVWCVSYNPDVADEELPKAMIRGVWKVVKYIADFGW